MTYDEMVIRADARDRARRTLLQNIGVDVAVAVAPLVYDTVTKWDGAFTSSYWVPVGVSVAKTAVVVIAAYVMRLKKPPAVSS